MIDLTAIEEFNETVARLMEKINARKKQDGITEEQAVPEED